MSAFYESELERGVVFDTNRIWPAKLPFLMDVWPNARVICCVRAVGWIIDSLERLLRRHPLQAPRLFGAKASVNLYARVDSLMNAESGLVGVAWSSLREAWFSAQASRLLLLSYEGLVARPDVAMKRLYTALGEPFFEHDFDHLNYDEAAFDADFGLPGLHTVHGRVAKVEREPCIPPDLFAKYEDCSFWRDPMRPGYLAPTVIC